MFSFSDILGINARHLLYIKKYNGAEATSFADNKLKTKRFLEARKIPVPKLLGVIRTFQELDNFPQATLPASIVLKPNSSSGGEGIVVLTEKNTQGWVKANGDPFTREQFYRHCSEILAGAFSKTGQKDICLIERRIISHEKLEAIAYKGLPDIRIIVLNMVPVMAMLRLPTKASDGKANMHMGGIGAGIDLAKGEITYLTQYNKSIDEIPEVGDIRGYKIPHWDEILYMAVKTQMITGVGYLGVDIALDKTGPLLLEMNARAGLGIQIANMAPLRKRLQMVEKLKVKSIEKGIRIAKDLFGRQIDRDIENLSGKKVIGTKEFITLFFKEGRKEILAKIDPTQQESFLKRELFEEIKEKKPHLLVGEESLRLRYQLTDERVKTIFKPMDSSEQMKEEIIIGRRELKNILIDPYKYKLHEMPVKPEVNIILPSSSDRKSKEDNIAKWKPIDNLLHNIETNIQRHVSLIPLNLQEEKEKFIEAKGRYNPHFLYKNTLLEQISLRNELEKLEIETTTPQGRIFYDKRNELLLKFDVYSNIGKDPELYTYYNSQIFAEIDNALVKKAKSLNSIASVSVVEMPVAEKKEIIVELKKVLKRYKLSKWNIIERSNMPSRIAVSKSRKRHIYINEDIAILRNELPMVLAHEVETHVLRLENSLRQPYSIFRTGLAKYLLTEEGLAIYNQELHKQAHSTKSDMASLTYLYSVICLQHSFQDAFAHLAEIPKYYQDPDIYNRLFRRILRVKRGIADTSAMGGYTKDLIYFEGYHRVLEYVDNGNDLKKLYTGKVSIESITEITQIEELVEPRTIPLFYNVPTQPYDRS